MMPANPLVRTLVIGGAAILILLLAWQYLFRADEAPAPRPKLDPSALVVAPSVATDLEVVDAMLGLAGIRPDEDVVDLGSGDGRILIAAARSYGAHGLGVDIDPAQIALANDNARAAGVAGRVAFRREDLFQTPIANADVLTLYLTQAVNLRLRPRILAQMQAGARVVSHDFDMGEWRSDQRQRVGDDTVYLWIVPARVDGAWVLSVGGREVPLIIHQTFQAFTGTAGDVRIEQGRLTGDRIRFVADFGSGQQTFEGRVSGDAITPVAANANWRARRSG